MIQFDEDKQNRKLADLHKHEEEELVQLLSAKYSLGYIDLTVNPINTDALRLIDEKTSRENKVVCFSLVDKKVKVAARNPQDPKITEIVSNLKEKGYIPTLFICSMQSLEKAWGAYKDLSFAYESKAGALEIASEEMGEMIKNTK
ncbi:MAG: hypothetical protein Q7S72_00405, partial [Candidatus Taylorbacteria bacterium]|nr:hypothetical protein [Candidatus Taylorbacteria bacterium]